MYKIEYLESAYEDIERNALYISQKLGNPTAARRFVSHIEKKVNNLASAPYMYPVYHALVNTQKTYRRIVVDNYIVLYIVDEDKKVVSVVNVIHGRRDIPKHLKS